MDISEEELQNSVYSSPISHPSQRNDDFGYGETYISTPTRKSKKSSSKGSKEDPADIAFWSPAKRQSWEAMKTNPNAFYYRHVDPGVVKRTGAWDEREKELFMKAIKIHPPSQGKWGLFAKNIPGRVGYQCRNFYHRLLESGELKEDIVAGEMSPVKKRERKSSTPTKVKKHRSKLKLGSDEEISYEDTDDESFTSSKKSPKSEKKSPKKRTFIEEENNIEDEFYTDPTEVPNKSIDASEIETLTLISSKLNQYLSEQSSTAVIEEQNVLLEDVVENDTELSNQMESIAEEIQNDVHIETHLSEEEVLVFSPRMKEPWKSLKSGQDVIEFPVEEGPVFDSNPPAYLSAKILKYNRNSQVNYLLLSLPISSETESKYHKIVKKRLSENVKGIIFSDAIREFFRVKKLCVHNPESKDKIIEQYAMKIINNEL